MSLKILENTACNTNNHFSIITGRYSVITVIKKNVIIPVNGDVFRDFF